MRFGKMIKSGSISKLEENLDLLKKNCLGQMLLGERKPIIFQNRPPKNQNSSSQISYQQLANELLKNKQANNKYLIQWVEQIYAKNFESCFQQLQQKKLKEDQAIAQLCKKILDNLYEFMRHLKDKIGNNYQQLHKCLKKINEQSKIILKRCLIWFPKSRDCQGIYRLKTIIKKDSFTFHQPERYFPSYTDIKFEQGRSIRGQLMKTLDFMMRGLEHIVPQYSDYQMSAYAAISCMMGQIFRSAGSIDFDRAFLQELQLFTLVKDRPIDPAIFLKMVSPSESMQKGGAKQDPMYSLLTKITMIRRSAVNPKQFSQDNLKGGVFEPVEPSLVDLMESWIEQLQKNLNDWADKPEEINNTLKPPISPTSPLPSPSARSSPAELQKNASFRLNKKDVQIVQKFAKQQKARLDKYLQHIKENWEKDYIDRTTKQPQKNIYKYLNNEHVSKLSTEITKVKGYYLFDYLTELIRSLQSVRQKAKEQIQKDDPEMKATNIKNLSLITFQIFDLISYKIEGDQDYLLTIYKYLRALHNRFPIGLSFLNIQDRTATSQNDLVLTVFLCNKYSLKILFKLAPQARITDNSANNRLTKFIQGLLKSDNQFGMIPYLTTFLCNFDKRTENLYRHQENLYPVKLQYPRTQSQRIKFCTLNLSKICSNPFQFHSYEKSKERKCFPSKKINKVKQHTLSERIDEEFKELYKKIRKNQDKKSEKKASLQFQQKYVGDFSRHPQYRYSILKYRNLGILQNGRLMNRLKFYQEWDKVYQSKKAEIKDKFGEISQQQKQQVRFFDLVCYEQVYNNSGSIHSQHGLFQPVKPLDNRNYCQYLQKLYNKPFVNQSAKYDKLVQFIDRYDIVFLQECSDYIFDKLNKNTNFSIYGKQNCFILITSKYLQKGKVLKQQKQIIIIQLDTYILISSQIDNINFKAGQFEAILQECQNKYQNKIIISGYNVTSLDVKINVIKKFDRYPQAEEPMHFTFMQKMTQFNMMQKQQKRQFKQKRDFLLCYNGKMEKRDVVSALKESIITMQDYYLPTDNHPFNHFIVEAQITGKPEKVK